MGIDIDTSSPGGAETETVGVAVASGAVDEVVARALAVGDSVALVFGEGSLVGGGCLAVVCGGGSLVGDCLAVVFGGGPLVGGDCLAVV